MTRLGIIADVHGDDEALRTALARLSSLGCAPILCAGDLLGDGPDHGATIDLLERHDVVCVRGNHDRWVLDQGQTLAADVRRFLEGLPRSWHGSFDGVRVAMVHGTPKSDMDGIYPAEASGPEL
jgi:predicted phosphodiesterase